MLHPLIVIVAIGLIYWLVRMKRKGAFRKHTKVEPVITNVEGKEVQTYLGVNTPLECLQDDGIRFGAAFRVKEGPALPHGPDCVCDVKEFCYTSVDVFNGALGANSKRESDLGLLSQKEARVFKETLKVLATKPDDLELEEFIEQCDLSRLPDDLHTKAEELFESQFA